MSHSIARRGGPCLRPLVVIPAYNEAPSLPAFLSELARHSPPVDIVVVDDGSTDDTPRLLEQRGVPTVRLACRLGVGSAMRAGIRYAAERGYQCVIRMDADGQHRPDCILSMLAPVLEGRADVARGSRYLEEGRPSTPVGRRLAQRLLALGLTVLLRRRITDPTSGLWVFGQRAISLLARHHPSGYAEPELVLLLGCSGLTVAEVPVEMRERLAGQTTLTLPRASGAFGRAFLAMLVVPLRRRLEEASR